MSRPRVGPPSFSRDARRRSEARAALLVGMVEPRRVSADRSERIVLAHTNWIGWSTLASCSESFTCAATPHRLTASRALIHPMTWVRLGRCLLRCCSWHGFCTALGDEVSAAEILVTILADPAGSQLVPPDRETIHESAERMRIELTVHTQDGDLDAWRPGLTSHHGRGSPGASRRR